MNERTMCKLLIKPPQQVLKVANKTTQGRFAGRVVFKLLHTPLQNAPTPSPSPTHKKPAPQSTATRKRDRRAEVKTRTSGFRAYL